MIQIAIVCILIGLVIDLLAMRKKRPIVRIVGILMISMILIGAFLLILLIGGDH
jgi:amino acid permease